jgi:transcriptional regulator with XRE-family HTH domain
MNKSSNVGRYLKQHREAKGLSLRGLAATAKVDAAWLSKVERGIYASPGPRELWRLAQALDVEPADLYLEAGYGDAHGLPGFTPYLRSKYDLPDEALAQLQAHFDLINERYGRDKDGAA